MFLIVFHNLTVLFVQKNYPIHVDRIHARTMVFVRTLVLTHTNVRVLVHTMVLTVNMYQQVKFEKKYLVIRILLSIVNVCSPSPCQNGGT